jgi:hypothetical protein
VIRDDGKYKHASRPRNDRRGSWLGDEDMRVWFGQLVNKGGAPKLGERDEAVSVSGNYAGRLVGYRVNRGDGRYIGATDIDVKNGCLTRGRLARSLCCTVLQTLTCLLTGIHWGDVVSSAKNNVRILSGYAE